MIWKQKKKKKRRKKFPKKESKWAGNMGLQTLGPEVGIRILFPKSKPNFGCFWPIILLKNYELEVRRAAGVLGWAAAKFSEGGTSEKKTSIRKEEECEEKENTTQSL